MDDYYITLTIRPSICSWANWIAQDENGQWCIYQYQPNKGHRYWFPSGGLFENIAFDAPNPDWENALYKIEREK